MIKEITFTIRANLLYKCYSLILAIKKNHVYQFLPLFSLIALGTKSKCYNLPVQDIEGILNPHCVNFNRTEYGSLRM